MKKSKKTVYCSTPNEQGDSLIKHMIEGEQPEIPNDAQKQIRERIKEVKEKRLAISDVVKCPDCGVFIPMQAGSCGVCTNCGNQIGGC